MLDKNSTREPKVIVELVSKEHVKKEEAIVAEQVKKRLLEIYQKARKIPCQNKG